MRPGADLDEIEALPGARAFRGFIARLTEVYQQGLAAFRERRPPGFTGP